MSAAENVLSFLAAMEASGIRPIESIERELQSGKIVRFRCEGDKAGKRPGWAVLHLDDHPAGRFGHWRMGAAMSWSAGSSASLSSTDRARLRREWQEAKERRIAERRKVQEQAAVLAKIRWTDGKGVDPTHPYLMRKNLVGEGLKQQGGKLLVPMYDIHGTLWNIQTIAADGVKSFLPGGRTKGLMLILGRGGKTLCIGEGYSTMAAVRAATGHMACAAFSASNLECVARKIRERGPHLDLVICGDDDAHLVDHPQIKRNVGLDAAAAAARAVGGRLALPRQGAR